jgi:hypothetical protein
MRALLRTVLILTLWAALPYSGASQVKWSFFATNLAGIQNSAGQAFNLGTSGGLNNPQMFHADVNGNGNEDLVVFDREGGRWLAFERVNGQWAERPEWTRGFPKNQQWVHVADFNCDGVPDIFGWVINGIGVWQGTRVGSNLTFSWALGNQSELKSVYVQGNPAYNLQVISVDRPFITDVDQDGDLDIAAVGMYPYGGDDPGAYDSICWWEHREGLEFVQHTIERDNCDYASLVSHDVDGDGRPDVVLGNWTVGPNEDRLRVYRNIVSGDARVALDR